MKNPWLQQRVKTIILAFGSYGIPWTAKFPFGETVSYTLPVDTTGFIIYVMQGGKTLVQNTQYLSCFVSRGGKITIDLVGQQKLIDQGIK